MSTELRGKWLGLRKQHEKLNILFQSQVTTDTAAFESEVSKQRALFESNVTNKRAVLETRIEDAKKKLLDKHLGEEQAFWSKHTSVTPKRSTGKTEPRPAQNKTAATEIIDLCSDDEGEQAPTTRKSMAPKPVQQASEVFQDDSSCPIPSATIELFGSSSKKYFVGHHTKLVLSQS
jgi:hypothetical protein